MAKMDHEKLNRVKKLQSHPKKRKPKLQKGPGPEWVLYFSKWKGFCGMCISDIHQGAPVYWNKETKECYHRDCLQGE